MDGGDVVWGMVEYVFGFGVYGDDVFLVVMVVNGDYGWFVQDDVVFVYINKGIGSIQVD